MRKMQEIQPELDELRKKYKDNPQKLQKEQMELFKKYKVNPLGGCLPIFFQIPIFLTIYQIFFRFVELKGASFLWIKDLSGPDRLLKLPFPPPVNYLNILPLLIVVASFLQQKITTSKASSQQQSTALMFTGFIGIVLYNFPSCIVLYWLIQNCITLAYQYRLSKVQLLSN